MTPEVYELLNKSPFGRFRTLLQRLQLAGYSGGAALKVRLSDDAYRTVMRSMEEFGCSMSVLSSDRSTVVINGCIIESRGGLSAHTWRRPQ